MFQPDTQFFIDRWVELARKAGDRRKRFEERAAGVGNRLPDGRILALIAVGVVLVVGTMIVIINALVDALRARMDPRLADA